MKKLLKKNGFTLVEIIVAFAVFAVMAAMIMMMVQLAISARHQNNIIVENMEYQQGYLVENVKENKYDNSGKGGQYSFEFTDGNTVSIDYSVVGAPKNSDLSDDTLGTIKYFVPNVDPDASKNNQPDTKKQTGQTQSSRYDTRITGTKGFKTIAVNRCEKDSSYGGPGVRYLFEVYVDPKNIDPISMEFAQYNLYFRDDSECSLTVDGSKTYTTKRPSIPTILDVGYVNSNQLLPSAISDTRVDGVNNYMITPLTRSGGVQIGYDYSSSSSVRTFGSQKKVWNNPYYHGAGYTMANIPNGGYAFFYVVFESDPKLTTKSFGEGSYDSGTGKCTYTANTEKDATTTEPNIYGAYYLKLPAEEETPSE